MIGRKAPTAGLDMGRPAPDERGSATVIAVGLIASVLMLTISGLMLASAVLASHRARAAGDLAALAGAGSLMRGGSDVLACELAAEVAGLNHGRLQQCSASGTEIWLTVAVPAGPRGVGVATARARAGPGPGAISVPVYGRAYPEPAAYAGAPVLYQTVPSLQYTIKAGQKYGVADEIIDTNYYYAKTFDSSLPGDHTWWSPARTSNTRSGSATGCSSSERPT